MSKRAIALAAWCLLGVTLGLNLAALALGVSHSASRWDDLAIGATILTYGIVGALIATRSSGNVIGWLMLGFSLLVAIGVFSEQYAIYALVAYPGTLPYTEWIAAPAFWLWTPAVGLLLLFVPLFFPDGRLPAPRWKWVAWFDAVLVSVTSVLFAVIPFADDTYPAIHNPVVILFPAGVADLILSISIVLLTVCSLLSVIALLSRFRRADRVARQQLKWVLLAIAFMAGSFLLNAILVDGLNLTALNGILNVLTDLAILSLPVAIGIAILRYRLWDIDIIIRKTATYSIVVALLAIVYFALVILLQQLFASVTGLRNNEIITVISTLAIAALFVPLRNRIQSAIDKRFYRKKYDAQQVLHEFAETVRDETDLDKLTGELLNVVNDTMQPKSVSVWLNQTPDHRRQPAERKR